MFYKMPEKQADRYLSLVMEEVRRRLLTWFVILEKIPAKLEKIACVRFALMIMPRLFWRMRTMKAMMLSFLNNCSLWVDRVIF